MLERQNDFFDGIIINPDEMEIHKSIGMSTSDLKQLYEKIITGAEMARVEETENFDLKKMVENLLPSLTPKETAFCVCNTMSEIVKKSAEMKIQRSNKYDKLN